MTERKPRTHQLSEPLEEGEPIEDKVTLAQRILAFDDRQFEVVEVPEWEEILGKPPVLRVRGLTGSERDSWEASLVHELPGGRGRTKMDFTDLRAKLVVRSVVDEDGQRIFTDAQAHALGTSKSASALQRIFEVAQKLSRLTDEDVEELTGNSPGGQSAANGSGSLSR